MSTRNLTIRLEKFKIFFLIFSLILGNSQEIKYKINQINKKIIEYLNN